MVSNKTFFTNANQIYNQNMIFTKIVITNLRKKLRNFTKVKLFKISNPDSVGVKKRRGPKILISFIFNKLKFNRFWTFFQISLQFLNQSVVQYWFPNTGNCTNIEKCENLKIVSGVSFRDMNELVKPGTPPPNYEHVAPMHACTEKQEKRPIYRKQNSCPGEIAPKRFTQRETSFNSIF